MSKHGKCIKCGKVTRIRAVNLCAICYDKANWQRAKLRKIQRGKL